MLWPTRQQGGCSTASSDECGGHLDPSSCSLPSPLLAATLELTPGDLGHRTTILTDARDLTTTKGIIRVARYYYHETVLVRNADDDVQGNVRKGLDITKAANYQEDRSRLPSTSATGSSPVSRSHNIAGTKRSSDCFASLTKAGSGMLPNRVHRRVILSDYRIPIYKAGSRQALLGALADCIEGHESLRQRAGLLHRDISISNVMVGKENRGF